MKKIILFVLLSVSLFATQYKVIYNLQSGDDVKVKASILKGIPALQEHYNAQGDSLSVVVIISNQSYKYFIEDAKNTSDIEKNLVLKSQEKFSQAMQKLAKSGVRFEICSAGMKKHQIEKEILYSYVHPAFNRTASLINWQNKGYGVIDIL